MEAEMNVDMEAEIRILIADDHPIVRQGLRQAIEREPRLRVLGDVGDGRLALEQIERLRPHVVLLDINMPGLDGFAVAREIRARALPVEIVFLTAYREDGFFDEALRLGAKGYVLKDSAPGDIISGILAVAAGEHYISPALTSTLVASRRARNDGPPGIEVLTPTERRILALIAEYKTSSAIAEALHVSPRTVQTHRANICVKLGLHGSHALMKFALDHKPRL
jgi:DNA-binding NarL/FixJ family response regulator